MVELYRFLPALWLYRYTRYLVLEVIKLTVFTDIFETPLFVFLFSRDPFAKTPHVPPTSELGRKTPKTLLRRLLFDCTEMLEVCLLRSSRFVLCSNWQLWCELNIMKNCVFVYLIGCWYVLCCLDDIRGAVSGASMDVLDISSLLQGLLLSSFWMRGACGAEYGMVQVLLLVTCEKIQVLFLQNRRLRNTLPWGPISGVGTSEIN